MKSISLKIPDSLWGAMEERRRATGEPIQELVRAALRDYLQTRRQTLFQVSTSAALVEGVYRGAVTVGELRRHGDFGLGTYEDIDGEMIALEGKFYQVRSDGTVREADDGDSTPFAVITQFKSGDPPETLGECADLAELCARLNQLRDSENLFYAIRVEGEFDLIHARAMCKTEEGVPLAVAAAHQPEFRLPGVAGTVVGFWSPEHLKALEIPGYHFHFLTADRRAGGHVLGCRGRGLRAWLQPVSDLRLALPENEEFLKADLTGDPSAELDRAETSPGGE